MNPPTEKRERPILFSGEMVRAILDGRKTQTRRVMKPQPWISRKDMMWKWGKWGRDEGPWMLFTNAGPHQKLLQYIDSPYGHEGTILWVKETFFKYGHWEKVAGGKTKTGKQKWKFVATRDETHYAENAPSEYRGGRHHKDPLTNAWHKRLGRFMPRKLSRLTLEITGIRVERLCSMRDVDARAEGCCGVSSATFGVPSFKYVWESINGKGSWEKNPWVWCISFKKI